MSLSARAHTALRSRRRPMRSALAAATCVTVLLGGAAAVRSTDPADGSHGPPPSGVTTPASNEAGRHDPDRQRAHRQRAHRQHPERHGPNPWSVIELHDADGPTRTMVRDPAGAWVATFTHGARTVTLAGPERRFEEATAAHGVTSTTWVRVLEEPFDGRLDTGWLRRARADRSPDVLAVAMEYLPGAPEVVDDAGVLISGEAAYGPMDDDGDRPVGSDWNDYQQVTVGYGRGRHRDVKRPTPAQAGAMDCSGFVRMVFGVRHRVPLTSKVDGGASLPRISRLQAREAPGVVPVPDRGEQVEDLDRVRPGDLVFFDAGDDREGIDHVGIHLGTDDAGRHRFVSSRRSSNGPTMGDHVEPSVLDGDELFARAFVATRRL